MQAPEGEIYQGEELRDLLDDHIERKRMVPIEEGELPTVVRMDRSERKGWMRNKPCPCGSGKKFKKCCWNKVTGELMGA